MSQAYTAATNQTENDPYRLPKNVKPLHYTVTVKTDLEALQFEGHVAVDLEVLEETSTIIFNAADLELNQASLQSEALKTEEIQIAEQSINTDLDRVTLKVAKALPKGKARLNIAFKAPLTNKMTGYYYSNTEIDGKKAHYTLTQFEPTDARRAFPCWDEPALKATYDIIMISRENTVNLSNMPAISEKPFTKAETEYDQSIGKLTKMFANLKTESSEGGWKITKFQTTPLISSYLVAYANGPFEYIEDHYTSPLSGKTRPVRMYATKDIIHQTKFALDVNVRCLSLYEKVFEVEYPLPKLDTLVAHDFDAGAMENWGLITGRTTAYLIDEEKSDIAAKKRVADVASHEVAHQWFGNITSPEWWDVLYLNEGFATLMGELVILDKLFPEWGAKMSFINSHLERALALDARRSSHPIEVPCDDAKKINMIFDALSYSKAGSVLRMLSDYVTEEKFLKGVSIYLKKHLYSTARTIDLWNGISEATGQNVPDLMHNWVNCIGFPVLTVTETSEGIKVRQDRYLETGDVKEDENQTLWKIPLNLLTVDESGKPVIKRDLMTEREQTYQIDTSKPYKLNAGTSGVYRVLYPPERVKLLGKQAVDPNSPFSVTDRMGLISDVMVLGKSGLCRTSDGLALLNELRSESQYLVWESIAEKIGSILDVWWEMSDGVRANMNEFRQSLFVPLVKKYGFEPRKEDTFDDRQLRTLAIGQAAGAEAPEVIKELQSRFKLLVESNDHSRILPDIQSTAYSIGVRFGGRAEWETAKKIFLNPPTPSARTHAIYAMTATRDPELIEETFKFLMTEVKSQDMMQVIRTRMYFFLGLNANRFTRRQTYAFFKDKFDELYKRFEGTFSLGNVVKISLKGFAIKGDLEDIQAFFKDKDTAKYAMPLEQSLDAIRSNMKWLDQSNSDVVDWLESWSASNKTNAKY
ncbi:Aminopeptidase 2; Flags: Precursor [Serendipita indica DSM 11827]|nr:Aminopeptidase 2; Flags: Precursor [Serendipita indica DSM 11827]